MADIVRRLMGAEELASYDAWVQRHPQGSLWQSAAWKRYQEALGREVRVYAATGGEVPGSPFEVTALVVIDRTTFGLCTYEIPRGPLWEMQNAECRMQNDDCVRALLETILEDAKRDRCFAFYLSPSHSLPTNYQLPATSSPRLLMPSATRVLNLTLSDDDLLSQMKPKGRYNISVAQRHGVRVERSRDVAMFSDLVRATGERQGFTAHPQRHYEAFLRDLPGSFLLLASLPPGALSSSEVRSTESRSWYKGLGILKGSSLDTRNSPIAGLLGVVWGGVGIYYYGSSNDTHRACMAPTLLQWEAMMYCRSQGCRSYDLFGVAPRGASPGHPWMGITRFKDQFGGAYVCLPPEQQVVLRPVTYGVLRLKRAVLG